MRCLDKDVFPWVESLPLAGVSAPMLLDTLRKVENRGTLRIAHDLRAPPRPPPCGDCPPRGRRNRWSGPAFVSHERPKAGRSRPSPAGIKESGKATFP